MVTVYIFLPNERQQMGKLQLVDSSGELVLGPLPVLGKADGQKAAANGNPSRDPLHRYGDTPLGTYQLSQARPTGNEHYPERSYGPHGFLPLRAVSGQALQAANEHGRAGLGIHGGALGAGGKLRPTYGCLRLFNDDQQELVMALEREGFLCQCVVESTSTATSITRLLESQVYEAEQDDGNVPDEPSETIASRASFEASSTLRGLFTMDTPLKSSSRLTSELFDKYLVFRERPLLSGLGSHAVEAQNKYNINATYIVAHAIQETGWGTSRIAREKNNLFGWSAFDDTPFESARGFPSREKCVDFVMGKINELYLNPNGRYFRGAVLGDKSNGMNVNYASDPRWGQTIASIAERIEKYLDSVS